MSKDGSYVCACTIETKEGSKEVEKKLLEALGPRCTAQPVAGGLVKHVWRVKWLTVAVLMAEAARQIPGVHAEAREPMEGE